MSDASDQKTYDIPHQDRRSVLGEGQSVTRAVLEETVADLVIPVEGIDAASDKTQKNQLSQARCRLAVTGAGAITKFVSATPV